MLPREAELVGSGMNRSSEGDVIVTVSGEEGGGGGG